MTDELAARPVHRGSSARRRVVTALVAFGAVALSALGGLAALHAIAARAPAPGPSSPLVVGSIVPTGAAAPAPASAAELDVVAPIVVGSTSKGWKVETIHAVREGTIEVTFVEEKGDGVIDLLVGLRSDDGASPPATAGRYDVFYHARRALPEEGLRLARMLARIIDRNQDAPVPAGLRPFQARPQEHQPL